MSSWDTKQAGQGPGWGAGPRPTTVAHALKACATAEPGLARVLPRPSALARRGARLGLAQPFRWTSPPFAHAAGCEAFHGRDNLVEALEFCLKFAYHLAKVHVGKYISPGRRASARPFSVTCDP